jgi:hypothetical protein
MGPKDEKRKKEKKRKINPDCPHRCEVVPGNPLAAERVV